MDFSNLFSNFDFFSWVVLPLMIFFARIIDVTLGTIRIIFVAKGNKTVSAILGFLEVLIWIIIMSQIMQNLNNVFCFFAFASGFSAGNYIGILIEEKLAMGSLMIQIITKHEASELMRNLRADGYNATTHQAQGSAGIVNVIYSVIKRNKTAAFLKIVNKFNPNSFYTIEDVRFVNEGVPSISSALLFRSNYLAFSKLFKKAKT